MGAIRESLSRSKVAYILAILVVLNVIRFWPHKKDDAVPVFPPPPPGGAMDGTPPDANAGPGGPGGPTDRERTEEILNKLPGEQRKAVVERIAEDRTFFDSIRDLPEEQRRQRMQEYFAQNPPLFPPNGAGPPMQPPGEGGNGAGPDSFGNGGMHLPPPGVRRSMDQQIANAQKKGNQ